MTRLEANREGDLRTKTLSTAENNTSTTNSQLISECTLPKSQTEFMMEKSSLISTSEPSCNWLPSVQKQFQAIASLPENWDSYGASRPRESILNGAWNLIASISQMPGVPKPHVNPTRNGGVQFEWEAGERYFELEIVAEDAAEYLYCDDIVQVEETGNVSEDTLEQVLTYIFSVGTPK